MVNRGEHTVLNIQVGIDELVGFERMHSAAVGDNATYVDLNKYIDNEECHDLVEVAMETYTNVDVFCFFI